MSVPVLFDAAGPSGINVNSHTTRARVAEAYLREWCADTGHDYDQTLDAIEKVRSGLLAGPDVELFVQLDAQEQS